MRVGVDVTPLQVPVSGGIGVATFETLRAMAAMPGHEIILYGTRAPYVPFSDQPLDLDLPLYVGTSPPIAGNIAWLQYGVGPRLVKDGVDVFWGTRHVLPRNARSVAKVMTLYDFWHCHHPGQQPIPNRMLNRYVLWAGARDADLFTAISRNTARELVAFLRIEPGRVRVVPLGVTSSYAGKPSADLIAAALTRHGVKQPYVLAVDVFNPRKNFELVLAAAAMVSPDCSSFTIVGVGAPRQTARQAAIRARAEALGLSRRLVLVGDVAPDELRALYAGATAFVYPSFYEGFGMPVLEAMAVETPVITSSASSLPEVVGEAALLIDPARPDDLAGALSRVMTDERLRRTLCRAGLERIRRYTWERTAGGMVAAFHDAVARREQVGR